MSIRWYDTLPSTNRAAAEAARDGCAEFFAVAARAQSAGRGRLSRTFFSPLGGTYVSIVLRPPFPASDYGALTPFAAVALYRAIRKTTGREAEIKWVNDLLLDGKKIAGILAESGTDQSGAPFVVVGIGVNTGHEPFPPALSEIAAHLAGVTPEELIPAVLAEFSDYVGEVQTAAWFPLYRARSAVLGRPVIVFPANGVSYPAVAREILADGALLVEREDGERIALCGGEISLRTAQSP